MEGECTISDMIAGITDDAVNHGDLLNSVAQMTNNLKRTNIITGKEWVI